MRTQPRHISLAAGLLATAAPTLAAAQAVNTFRLDPITLIATGLPTEVFESPASTTIITAEEIKRRSPVSVATLLRDVPGLHISEEGIERISIRGETSRRVAIMIDGQKLTDHTNYGQPILIDPTTIERIEVVRGSSSVVSGSAAIGGVINIVTKTGADKPFALSTMAGYFSATDGYRVSTTASGTVPVGAGEFDYRLTFGKMDQGDRETPDGTLVPSGIEDETRSLHLGYRQGNHSVAFRAHSYDLAADVWTGDPNFLISLPHRDLRKYALSYEGTELAPWLDRLSMSVYRQTVDRAFVNDITQFPGPMRLNILSDSADTQETWGATLRAEMQFTPSSRTVVGIEYEDDRLEADKHTVTTVSGPMLPVPSVTIRDGYDDATIRTWSIYGQHEMDLSDTLTANIGARWYDVEAEHVTSIANGVERPTSGSSGSLLLGAAGLVWRPTEDWALRANLSQGYIYPNLGQMFLTTTGGGVTLVGNPELDPETSTTFELGARHQGDSGSLDATLFYTKAEDYIATVITGSTGTYQNVDQARSWGVEIQAERDIGDTGLTAHASVAAMRRELRYANGFETFDSGTPELSGTIGLRQDWTFGNVTGGLDLFVRGESGLEFRDATGEVVGDAGGYATLNLRADADLGNGVTLVAEVMNITDRSYQPYGQMPGSERSLNLFLTSSF